MSVGFSSALPSCGRSEITGEEGVLGLATDASNDRAAVIPDAGGDQAVTCPSGALDPTFGQGGVVGRIVAPEQPDAGPLFGGALAIAVDPSTDAIIVLTNLLNGQGLFGMGLFRFLKDGTPDLTFGTSGKVVRENTNTFLQAMGNVVLQPDGKIVVALTISTPPSGIFGDVMRFLPTGLPDPTFGKNGEVRIPLGATDFLGPLTIESDGAILLSTMLASGDFEVGAFRLRADGTLDSSFGVKGLATTKIPAAASFMFGAAPEGDGAVVGVSQPEKLVLIHMGPKGVTRSSTVGLPKFGSGPPMANLFGDDSAFAAGGEGNPGTTALLARVRVDGDLDPRFGDNGVEPFAVSDGIRFWTSSSTVQGDGKLLLTGAATALDAQAEPRVMVARFLAGGAPDPDFATQGVSITNPDGVPAPEPTVIALQSDGRIVVGGTQSSSPGATDVFLARICP